MDATFTLARLSENFSALLNEGDFEGAEEFLMTSLSRHPEHAGFWHFQFGRLYRRWNKLSSAILHLNQAVDCALGNQMFLVQILDELNSAKISQKGQRP